MSALLLRSEVGELPKIIGWMPWLGVVVSLLLAWLIRGFAGASWVYETSLRSSLLIDPNLVEILARVVVPIAFVGSAVLLALPWTRGARASNVFGVIMALAGLVAAASLPSQPALVGPATAFAATVWTTISFRSLPEGSSSRRTQPRRTL